MNRGTAMNGRTVLVTGGSRGIGRAIVNAMHRDGAYVVAHSRRLETGQALRDDFGDERLHLVVGDLASPDHSEQVWADALAWRGRIDVLVNNAGAWLASPIDDSDAWDAGWDANLRLNLIAPATLCRLAIAHFRTIGGGIVVNLASRSSHRGDDAEHLAYGAAKGGLLALTKGIARGFAAERILAYAVAPGWVATEIAEGADVAGLATGLPMREITPPTDVAEVVAFLASGRSPHTTGATIDITGADYVR
jgi:3-oxoacyl-[acyl-carrier protein] reductase